MKQTQTKKQRGRWLCADPVRKEVLLRFRVRSINERKTYQEILTGLAKGFVKGQYDEFLRNQNLTKRNLPPSKDRGHVVPVPIEDAEKVAFSARAKKMSYLIGAVMSALLEGYANEEIG